MSNAYVRPSALGPAEYCPRSTEISEQSGISREALKSSAWHALNAGDGTALEALRPDERDEVAGWARPGESLLRVFFGKDIVVKLAYGDAVKEHHVRLMERDALITEGTLDFAWVVEVNGQKWAVVGDLKRNSWSVPDGPDCLQLAAYGHAYAMEVGAVAYTPVLFGAMDGEWLVGQAVDLTSPEALDLWKRIKRAAKNDHRQIDREEARRAVTGAHCRSCYGRQACPEWAILATRSAESDAPITEASAASALLSAQAMEERAERIREAVKVLVERGATVVDKVTGKVFLPVVTAGRESLDKAALLKDYPEAAKYWRKGKPGARFEWRRGA